MNAVFAIAKNTLKQTIRDKILYGIMIFGLIFIGSTVILSSLAIEENLFIIKSIGLAGIYIFGLIITIFLGASLVYDEVEKQTTYVLLAKPVTRTSILVGKFLGLLTGIIITLLFMLSAYLVIVYLNGGGIDYLALIAIGLQIMEMAILIALLILFSVFTSPLASTIYTILILYIGHLLGLILAYSLKTTGLTKLALMAIYYILPNLEKFNIRNSIVHNISISFKESVASTIYALIYIVFIMYIANSVFNRKDL